MLSVADVPVAGFHFRGVIGVVLWKGRVQNAIYHLYLTLAYVLPKGFLSFQSDFVLSEYPLLSDEMQQQGNQLSMNDVL